MASQEQVKDNKGDGEESLGVSVNVEGIGGICRVTRAWPIPMVGPIWVEDRDKQTHIVGAWRVSSLDEVA